MLETYELQDLCPYQILARPNKSTQPIALWYELDVPYASLQFSWQYDEKPSPHRRYKEYQPALPQASYLPGPQLWALADSYAYRADHPWKRKSHVLVDQSVGKTPLYPVPPHLPAECF